MYKEEVTIQNKYTNWIVWKDREKKNLITILPMTPAQALKHFGATAVKGLT